MSNKIIFKVEYGGLGDHLFYSALPRMLKDRKIADEVYLSKQSNFRNPEIFNLIWKNNPYLDGVTNEPVTKLPEIRKSKENNIVNLIFEKFNIFCDQEISMEIYTKLDIDPSLRCEYIDLNYVSFVGAFSWFDKMMVLKKYPHHVIVNPGPLTDLIFPNRKKIHTRTLMEYAKLIYSSTSFVTLASGGATLAAALKKPSIIYYGFGQNTIFHHEMHNYIQVGSANLFRRRLARFYEKRNYRRLKNSNNK